MGFDDCYHCAKKSAIFELPKQKVLIYTNCLVELLMQMQFKAAEKEFKCLLVGQAVLI